MKTSKKMLVVVVLVLALLLIITTPVMADRSLVCEGDDACRINLLSGTPTEYTAGAPFFVLHGTGMAPSEDKPVSVDHMGFALEVDGVYVEPDWVSHFATSAREGYGNHVYSLMAFNFPQGLSAGVHTFTGHWYVGCAPRMEEGGWCVDHMHPTDWNVITMTVVFK